MRPNRQIVPLRNFNPNEFLCKCGRCNKSTDPELMVRLQAFLYIVEAEHNAPVRCFITSPARCEEHNARIYGGEFRQSYHMGINRGLKPDTHGAAVDVIIEVLIADKWLRIEKERAAELAIKSNLFGGVGWQIYGTQSRFLHLDMGETRTF